MNCPFKTLLLLCGYLSVVHMQVSLLKPLLNFAPREHMSSVGAS